MSRLIPKKQKGKKIFFNQNGNTLKEQRIQANQQHKDLANQNWKEGNILKAAYHWWKGTPGLGGQFENDYIVQSGVAPAIGLKGVPSPEAIKKAEAIATGTKAVGTSANVSKTISNSNALETGKGVSEVINYFKVKFKTMGQHPRVAKARNNPDFEKWYNKRCLYGYKHPEEQSKIATEVVDKVIKLENGIK